MLRVFFIVFIVDYFTREMIFSGFLLFPIGNQGGTMAGITIINNIPQKDVAQIVTDLKNKKYTIEVVRQGNGNYAVKAMPPRKMRTDPPAKQ